MHFTAQHEGYREMQLGKLQARDFSVSKIESILCYCCPLSKMSPSKLKMFFKYYEKIRYLIAYTIYIYIG